MNVEIEGVLPRPFGLSRARLAAAAGYFAERSGRRACLVFRNVAVLLQDDAESEEAHLAVMGVGGATDVITQRFEPIPPEPPGVYGELYVNRDMAARVAPEIAARRSPGWTPADELLLYVAHGMDHLSGADDSTPKGRAAMRRRELEWIKDFGR